MGTPFQYDRPLTYDAPIIKTLAVVVEGRQMKAIEVAEVVQDRSMAVEIEMFDQTVLV